MLCAKALKAVKAAFVLMIGFVGLSAYAEIGEISHTATLYASETVDATSKAGTGLMQVDTSSTLFSVKSKLRAALPASTTAPKTYYFRVDLVSEDATGAIMLGRTLSAGSGADLNNDVVPDADFYISDGSTSPTFFTTADADVNGSTTLVFGGGSTSSEAVFQVTRNSDIPLGSVVHVDMNRRGSTSTDMYGLRIKGATGAAGANNSYTVRIRVYDDYSEAIRATADTFGQDLLTDEGVIVRTVKALSVTVKDPKTITADVAEGFKKFTPATGGEKGTLATVSVATMDDLDHDGKDTTPKQQILNATTGMQIKQADILKSASVDFSGDFSVGKAVVGSTGGTLLDANGKAIAMTGEGGKSYSDADKLLAAMVRIPVSGTGGAFALDVKGNEMRIREGSYTASVMVTLKSELANSAAHQLAGGIAAGTIVRNGTSANVGYVTTSGNYNQRLVLTNHGMLDADFMIHSLVVEAGNTGMLMAPEGMMLSEDGMELMGMIMKGQTVVIRMQDIVSITGDSPPRGALTVDMSTRTKDASIATTQVNLSDGSADTVSYHP